MVPGNGVFIILSRSASLAILTNPIGELTFSMAVFNADKLFTDVDLSALIFNESVGTPAAESKI